MKRNIGSQKLNLLTLLLLALMGLPAEARLSDKCLKYGDCVVDPNMSYDESDFVKMGGEDTEAAIGFCSSGACGNRPPHEEMKDWQFIKSHYYGKESEVLKDVPRDLKWVRQRVFVVGKKLNNGKLKNYGIATLATAKLQQYETRDSEVFVTNAHVLYDENCNLYPRHERTIYDFEGNYAGVLEPFSEGTTCPTQLGLGQSDWAVAIVKGRKQITGDELVGKGVLAEEKIKRLYREGLVEFTLPVFDRDNQSIKINAKNCQPFAAEKGMTWDGVTKHNCPAKAGDSGAPMVGCFKPQSGYDGCFLMYLHNADQNSQYSGSKGKHDKEKVMRYAPYKPGYNENYAVPLDGQKANSEVALKDEIDRASEIESYAHFLRGKDLASAK
ncbi:MAG: hypothetical protein H6626_10880 [Pseudobdellovibrionaceae bacterium]|nr:MAG: hypothetical protein H6626_10880 [Pseudobdellovibrionaceae bacterium]